MINLKNMGRNKKFFNYASFIATVFSLPHLFLSLPSKMPLVGDDYLFFRDVGAPNDFSHTFWGAFWQTGQGKWRPGFVPLGVFLVHRFGSTYDSYQLLNKFLLVILGLIFGWILFQVTKIVAAIPIGVVLVVGSRMTVLDQVSIYGVMELLAAIWAMLAVAVLIEEIINERSFLLSRISLFFFLFMASITHERYVFLALGVAAGVFLLDKTRGVISTAYIFVLIPVLIVFIRSLILGTEVVVGGGESKLSGFSFWMFERLGKSILAVSGMHSGIGVYFDKWPLSDVDNSFSLGWIAPLLLFSFIASLLLVILKKMKNSSELKSSERAKLFTVLTLFVFLLLSLLLPIATVKERIEGRWLLLPQLVLIIFVAYLVMKIVSTKIKCCLLILSFLTFFGTDFYYRNSSESLIQLWRQPQVIITESSRIASSQDGPWVLIVNQDDPTMPIWWQLGLGGAASSLTNAPVRTVLGNRNDCKNLKAFCVVATVRGLSAPTFEYFPPAVPRK